MIDKSDPALMAKFIDAAGFRYAAQPVPVGGDRERGRGVGAAAARGERADRLRARPGRRASRRAIAGRFIATPYHDVKVTDPDKLAHMTSAYQKHLADGSPLTEDIRDVFLDSGLAEMGFAPLPAMDGRELLAQQCQQCHHAKLDPTITRDRFLVDQLDQMPRAEKDLAIERIQTPVDPRLTMPPPLFRSLTQADRDE